MRCIYQIIGSISAFAGILLILLVLVDVFIINEGMLNYTNNEYGVAEILSISEEELRQVVHEMVTYVKGRSDDPQIMIMVEGEKQKFYTDREIEHLDDVRRLYGRIRIAFLVLFLEVICGVMYLRKKNMMLCILKGIYSSWIIILVLGMIVALVSYVDIKNVVNVFHKIFFNNSNWVLNPVLHRSVWMFRNHMYKDIVMRLGVIVGITATFSLGVSTMLYKYLKKHCENL